MYFFLIKSKYFVKVFVQEIESCAFTCAKLNAFQAIDAKDTPVHLKSLVLAINKIYAISCKSLMYWLYTDSIS